MRISCSGIDPRGKQRTSPVVGGSALPVPPSDSPLMRNCTLAGIGTPDGQRSARSSTPSADRSPASSARFRTSSASRSTLAAYPFIACKLCGSQEVTSRNSSSQTRHRRVHPGRREPGRNRRFHNPQPAGRRRRPASRRPGTGQHGSQQRRVDPIPRAITAEPGDAASAPSAGDRTPQADPGTAIGCGSTR